MKIRIVDHRCAKVFYGLSAVPVVGFTYHLKSKNIGLLSFIALYNVVFHQDYVAQLENVLTSFLW